MRKIRPSYVALLFWLGVSPTLAQNVTCPTRPVSDNSNACASTAFVQSLFSGAGFNFPLTVVNGVSGGIPYFASTTSLAASGLLAQYAVMVGGGAGGAPTTLGSLGLATTVLHGNASGLPSFAAVNLATDVTGSLPTANVANTAPGTGGQTRTQSAINSDFVDVFNYLTSAQIADVTLGTCTLNVATSINNALTAMGPGTLKFPFGKFCVSAPIIGNTEQILDGAGPYATTIQNLPGAATVLYQSFNFASLVGTNTTGGPYSFGLRNIGFNGNKANVTGTPQDNIDIYGYDFTFDNVISYNASAGDLFTQWGTYFGVPVPAGGDGMEAHIRHLKLFSAAGTGWTNEGPHDMVLDDVLIFINGGDGLDCLSTTTYECGITGATNVHTYHNQTGEIYISGVATIGAWMFGSNITVESDVAGPGLNVGAYGWVAITNLWDFGNHGRGIDLSGSSIASIITSCRTSGNGSANNFGSGNTITACP